MKHLLILPLVMLLTSCAAHLSQQECLTTNWQHEGFYDAVAGKLPRDLARASEDCARYGIGVSHNKYGIGYKQGAREYCSPEAAIGYADGLVGKPLDAIYVRTPVCNQAGIKLTLTAYQAGRQKGLQSFCTAENGMNLAREGKALPDVCPTELRGQFTEGYSFGREQYCVQSKNGFALGKANQPYPDMCTPARYIAFKSEYDRGAVIGQRMSALKTRIDELNERISKKENQYGLVKLASGYYKLSYDKSKSASEALASVNSMVKERQPLDAELFSLQVMR